MWVAQRHAAVADYKRVLNERENALLSLSERKGPRSEANKGLNSELHDAQVEYHQIQAVVRRPLNKLWVRWRFFAAGALALALLEAPVNKYLFDVALMGAGWVSFSVSIVVAFALLAAAHFAGKCLRQVWSQYRRRIVWSNVLMFVGLLAIIATIICVLTVGRAATSATSDISGFGDLFTAVTLSVKSLGFWGTLGGAFSNLSALILATVNLGGVGAALLLAYFSHDPDGDYDVSAATLDRKRQLSKKLNAAYLKQRNKAIDGFRPDLTGISSKHAKANQRVIELKTRLGQPLDSEDHVVIDELDTLAEDSEHAEEAGIVQPQTEVPAGDSVREFPRRAAG
jgi:hypothetical protein